MVQLLQSGDPAAAAFLDTFKQYKISCPSIEDCSICSAECLMDVDCQNLGDADEGSDG